MCGQDLGANRGLPLILAEAHDHFWVVALRVHVMVALFTAAGALIILQLILLAVALIIQLLVVVATILVKSLTEFILMPCDIFISNSLLALVISAKPVLILLVAW